MSGESDYSGPERRKKSRRSNDQEIDKEMDTIRHNQSTQGTLLATLTAGLNGHLHECAKKHNDHAAAIADNTALTQKIYNFLAADMKAAEDWKHLKTQTLSGFNGFVHSRQAARPLWLIAVSGFLYVAWRVGGLDLLEKAIHLLF